MTTYIGTDRADSAVGTTPISMRRWQRQLLSDQSYEDVIEGGQGDDYLHVFNNTFAKGKCMGRRERLGGRYLNRDSLLWRRG